jgi:single-strand DNA-binding protein
MFLNNAQVLGYLGKDPELRKTSNGTSVASFSLCTTERFTDRDGKKQERSEWHNIVAWGNLGESCKEYLRKGAPAYVQGRLSTRTWEDKDGKKRYTTEIIARDVQFLQNGNNKALEKAPVIEDDLPF